MKSIKLGCCVLALLLVVACSKEDDPITKQKPRSALEEIVVGKYWTEEIYFMRWSDSHGVLAQDERVIGPTIIGGCDYHMDNITMGTIYVREDGKVHRYYKNEYGIYPTYLENQYTISYGPNSQSLRIDAKADSLHYMGAVTGLDMLVTEMHEDQIVFDVPIIKEYISTRWCLYRSDGDYSRNRVVGLRIYWKQASPVNFQYAEPLD